MFEMGAEDGWSDAEPHDLNTLGTHGYILLVLDDMFEIFVYSDVVRANQKVKILKWSKQCIDRGIS